MSQRATGPCLRALLLLVLLATVAERSFGKFDDAPVAGSFGHSGRMSATTSFGNFADATAQASSFRTFAVVAKTTLRIRATSFGNFDLSPLGRWVWSFGPAPGEFVPHFSVARGGVGILQDELLDSS